MRTYAWWAHDDVESVVHTLLGELEKEGLHPLGEFRTRVFADVCLTIALLTFIYLPCTSISICPCWVEVQAENIAISAMRGVGDGREEFGEVGDTVLRTCVVVVIPPALGFRTLPATTVEIGVEAEVARSVGTEAEGDVLSFQLCTG